jgi:hypothetical protein
MPSLKRLGFLTEGFSSVLVWSRSRTGEETGRIRITCLGDKLRLNYKSKSGGEDWRDIEEYIHLICTKPNFGGERQWMICPSCFSRRAALYGGTYFRCRECYGACYQTQLEDGKFRALTKLYKRRQKYGSFGNADEPFPPKPKWMRWPTYFRLKEADQSDLKQVLTSKWH